MHYVTILLSIIASYTTLVLGDFHVSYSQDYTRCCGLVSDFIACPSNYWNCNCYGNAERAGYISNDPGLSQFQLPSFFSIKHLCGVDQLNLYQSGERFVTHSLFSQAAVSNNALAGKVISIMEMGRLLRPATQVPIIQELQVTRHLFAIKLGETPIVSMISLFAIHTYVTSILLTAYSL